MKTEKRPSNPVRSLTRDRRKLFNHHFPHRIGFFEKFLNVVLRSAIKIPAPSCVFRESVTCAWGLVSRKHTWPHQPSLPFPNTKTSAQFFRSLCQRWLAGCLLWLIIIISRLSSLGDYYCCCWCSVGFCLLILSQFTTHPLDEDVFEGKKQQQATCFKWCDRGSY